MQMAGIFDTITDSIDADATAKTSGGSKAVLASKSVGSTHIKHIKRISSSIRSSMGGGSTSKSLPVLDSIIPALSIIQQQLILPLVKSGRAQKLDELAMDTAALKMANALHNRINDHRWTPMAKVPVHPAFKRIYDAGAQPRRAELRREARRRGA